MISCEINFPSLWKWEVKTYVFFEFQMCEINLLVFFSDLTFALDCSR